MARRLFGTDGVRGVAGEYLTAELAVALARVATTQVAAREDSGARPAVLVLRDTRESGEMLEAAICAGVADAGGDAFVAGVLPTPAAPILVDRLGLDMAVVISASHNPYRDNGIKFFGPDGCKLSDDIEARIERALGEDLGRSRFGRIRKLEGAENDYSRALRRAFDIDLTGHKIALDCANGATYRVAPAVFEQLGADLVTIGTDPDGRNINADVGSTHLGALCEAVVSEGCEVGFAFDGDGDRVLAVDARGDVLDGDELLAVQTRYLVGRGSLRGSGVAVTVMSNYGLEQAMSDMGVEVARTDVGDRNVVGELMKREWRLGGEQSGHLIDLEWAPTGDGIAAALSTLRALDSGVDGLRAGDRVSKLPQRLVNVAVADRSAVEGAIEVWEEVERVSRELEGRGRVLLRPSGTEPLVRVMVEAPGADECEAVCDRLVAVVRRALS